jgi:di/tricarboxylate transporter
LSGFSSPAVITVWAVFIVSAGLFQTGIANLIGLHVSRLANRSEIRLTVVLTLTVGVMSAFMNNVGATAVLLPVVISVARRADAHPSKLLIPLAFSSLLGGLMTLIGTPANVLISDALSEGGFEPFSLFDFAPVGLVLLLSGVLFMTLIGRRILPERRVEDKVAMVLAMQRKVVEQYQLDEQLFEVRVSPSSSLVGLSIDESQLGQLLRLNVVGIVRDGNHILAPDCDEIIEANDLLLVQGQPEQVIQLKWMRQVEIEEETHHWTAQDLASSDIGVVEALLAPNSNFIGRTLRSIDFRRRFGLTVLAIWREGQPYRTALADRPLHFGDSLLVQGPRPNIYLLSQQPDFLILGGNGEPVAAHTNKAPLALVSLILTITLIGFNLVPVAIGMLVGAVLMMLTGCLSVDEAHKAIQWKAVFLVAGMLPLGIAMHKSGTATYLADLVIDAVGGMGPFAVMAGLFALTLLITQVVSNAVAAVLVAPIALTAALSLGASPRAFLMAVAVAASSSFSTPVAHQVNVLVMGPGGYHFGDYTRVGLPLTVLVFVVTMIVLPIFWPL